MHKNVSPGEELWRTGKLILSDFKLNTRRGLVHMVTFLADIRWNESKFHSHTIHSRTLQMTEVVCGALQPDLRISCCILHDLITGVSRVHKEVNRRLWCTCMTLARIYRERQILRDHWQASLVELASSGFNGKPCL